MAGSLSIITPTTQNANRAFAVSGIITGYAAAPVLNYAVDAGAFGPLPANATVTGTTFTFTSPGLAAGTHTITVRDANNTTVVVATGSFSVVAATTPVVSPDIPSQPVTATAFTVAGSLANYASAPTLTYSDNNGVATPLPAGSSVTTSLFQFPHPPLPAGGYTTVVSDGTNAGSTAYIVTTIPGGASLDPTTATPGVGFAIDNAGNRWSVSPAGRVVVNGIDDFGTSNVILLAWVNNLIWQENTSNNWYSKTSPTASWLPAAGTTTSPLAGLPTITINAIPSPAPNTPFVVTGSLTNYTTAPTLTYADNTGPATAFPAGSTVTTTAFSFTHPLMPSGSDTMIISDGTYSAQISYTVAAAGWTSLAPTTNLTATITGLAASTAYDIEVYATNSAGQGPASAILTTSTTAPAVIIPSVPLALTSTAVTQTTVSLSWTAPATGTPPYTYQPRFSLQGANNWVGGPTVSVTSAQITGLTASTSYDFEVAATNSAGTSGESTIYTVATAAAPPPTVTWNPALKSATMTLSNGNLTATAGGSSTPYSQQSAVVATTFLASGKVSFEVTMSTITQNCAVGLVTASYPLTDDLGADTFSIGYYMSTGTGSQAAQTVYFNNNPIMAPAGNALAADVGGAVFTFCVDITNHLIWITGPSMQATYGAGAWNDSASANPGTGVGGVSFSAISGGAVAIAFQTYEGTGAAVLNAGSSAFVRAASIPSTFPAWNGATVTVTAPGSVSGLASGAVDNSSVVLNWVAPATGTPPFTYNVQQSPHSAGTYTTVATTSANTVTITGLAAATSYDFRVSASNAAGTGGFSPVLAVTTTSSIGLPGAPTALSAGTATTTTMPLTWSSPTSGTAPTGYQVQYKLATDSTWTNFSPTVSAGSNQVVAPLTGTVTAGSWVLNQQLAVAAMPHGYIQYNYLLPAQYNSSLIYPILFYGHQNDEGMNGSVYAADGGALVNQTVINGTFNTVAFRTNFPCIVVVPECDQSLDLSGANGNANFGGYNDTPNSGGNEQGINALLNFFISNFPVDPNRRYCTGDSLGGIGVLAWLADNNQLNGVNKLWTAGFSLSDQLFRPNVSGGSNNGVFTSLQNVPLLTVPTPSDNNPSSYDLPAWTFYTGNSTYPVKAAYDATGVAACRAGATQYYLINTTSGVPWNTFRQLNADGGDGTKIYNWLFSQTFGVSRRTWYNSPGMDGSFWVQPFQSSANWITTGSMITALRNGSGSSPQAVAHLPGNFSAPFYVGQATDPLVQVNNGTHGIFVRIPLGAVVETPNSATDNSIGGADATQPYLIWSISGATINTGSVAATGSVINGTYGMCVMDGAGQMMVDAVTGNAGNANSFGGITSYDLAQLSANPNYVMQHMLAYSLDPNVQCSGAGPMWPLAIVDTSSPNTGPIPQGCTIGIPATTPRPAGQSRAFYAWFDCLQQFGAFFYNVAASGATSFFIYDQTGANTTMANAMVAAVNSVMQYVCILNYNSGISGAQYSPATCKGAIPGSTNAFPAPPPLDLSPTGGVNVAPSTFGAWYPSGYGVTPTNTP